MFRRAWLPIFALVALWSAPALAAPPAEPDPEDPEACQEPTLDSAKLMTSRDLSTQGYARYENGDYLGAIEMWEQVLVLMPEQSSLRVYLGHAHRKAYDVDADPDHLGKAMTLFNDELAEPDILDEQRVDLEAEITEIEAELQRLADAEAQAQAEREEAIRQEQNRLNEAALAEVQLEGQRKIQKVYYGVGGAMAGLGVGGLAAMTALLALGEGVDAEGRRIAASTGVQTSDYTDLLDRGKALNRGAITAGVIGGVLAVSGTSLLIAAAIRQKRVIGPAQEKARAFAVVPTLGGLQLRF